MKEGAITEGVMLAVVVMAILVAWVVAAWVLLCLVPRHHAAGHHAIKQAGVGSGRAGASGSASGNSGTPAPDTGWLRRRDTHLSASPATPSPPGTYSPPAAHPRPATPSPPSTSPPPATSADRPDKRLTLDTLQARSGVGGGTIWPHGGPGVASGGEVRRRLLDRRQRLISRLYDPSEDAAHVLSLYFTPPSRPSSRPSSRHVSRERDHTAGTPLRRSAPSTPAPASPLLAPAKVGRGIFGDGVAGTGVGAGVGAGRGCGGHDTHSDDSGISVDDRHQQVCTEGEGGRRPLHTLNACSSTPGTSRTHSTHYHSNR